jgi:hypothetical protein
MMPPGPEIALRAVGTALAGLSIAFAAYMLAYGGGKIRVNGMEHLAIFAQPRGTATNAIGPSPRPAKPVDMAPTGSLADLPPTSAPEPRRVEIVAARADRVWLMIDGAIRSAAPGDDAPGVGHIGAIVPRDGGWAVLDDKGATLLTLAKRANGAPLFSHKLIFE